MGDWDKVRRKVKRSQFQERWLLHPDNFYRPKYVNINPERDGGWSGPEGRINGEQVRYEPSPHLARGGMSRPERIKRVRRVHERKLNEKLAKANIHPRRRPNWRKGI